MATSLNSTTGDATPLTYGSLAFDGNNGVPASANIGELSSDYVVSDYPGGTRIVDFMGVRAEKVEWSGTILGPQAAITLRTMQSYQKDGKERLLSWWVHAYYAVVEKFTPTGRSANRLDYKVTFIVTRSASGALTGTPLSAGNPNLATVPAAQLVYQAATPMVAIQNADTSAKATGLAAAMSSLQKFFTNTQTAVTAQLQQVNSVLAQAETYSSTLSQLSPAFAPTQQLVSYLQQMSSNLGSSALGNSVSIQGPASLYDTAVQYFGSPTRVSDILALNPSLGSPRIPANTSAVVRLPAN